MTKVFTIAIATTFSLLLPLSARTVELGFPGLQHRLQVSLPDDHDANKKYPAMLYYHGQGGKPDVAWMRHHAGAKDWIIVGMSYFQLGKITLNQKTLAKEMTLLRSVKKHLTSKYGMDPKQCYVSGFSKGGWMTDLMLQADSSLAGGVILGAGHMHTLKNAKARTGGKPLFIGVGRLDPNYSHAFGALLHHRKRGMKTSMEVWPDMAHTMPRDGSRHLMQWMSLRVPNKPNLKQHVQSTIQLDWESAQKLSPLPQWKALLVLRDAPYTQALGKEWIGRIQKKITQLSSHKDVAADAKLHGQFQNLLHREVTQVNLESIAKVQIGYQNISDKTPSAAWKKLANHDADRTAQLLNLLSKQNEAMRVAKEEQARLRREHEENKPKPKPIVPTPGKKGKIPVRPIFR